jgi:hypothetical protein
MPNGIIMNEADCAICISKEQPLTSYLRYIYDKDPYRRLY